MVDPTLQAFELSSLLRSSDALVAAHARHPDRDFFIDATSCLSTSRTLSPPLLVSSPGLCNDSCHLVDLSLRASECTELWVYVLAMSSMYYSQTSFFYGPLRARGRADAFQRFASPLQVATSLLILMAQRPFFGDHILQT